MTATASAACPPAVSLTLWPVLLVVLAVLLQTGGWAAGVLAAPDRAVRTAYALAEMLLLALLVWNGWRIRAWVLANAGGPGTLQARVVTLSCTALAVCVLGDLVNRNLGQRYFAYDRVVEHSYLADSVWFFLPGYALFIGAARLATRHRVPAWLGWPPLALAGLAGAGTFAGLVLPGTSPYVQALTGAYTVLISMMVPAGLWLLVGLGVRAWPVALGAVLATVADALIGQFWLYGHGWYPGIAHLNFGVYFLSQALLQRLPLALGAGEAADHGECVMTHRR